MSLSVLRDGDGGRNERCQWQDTDSINITGPVGVRVHGTLRRDVLLGCGTAFTIICMHIQYMLIVHFHQSYHNLPVWHKPGWQRIKLILDNPSIHPPFTGGPLNANSLLTHQPPRRGVWPSITHPTPLCITLGHGALLVFVCEGILSLCCFKIYDEKLPAA